MHFDVSELRDLERDLEKGAAKVAKTAPLVVKKSVLDIEADAKINAPVDTGNLESSISSDIDGLSGECGPTASYGGFVEGGTSRMAAQPYMGPAFEKHVPAFEAALGKVAEKIL
ncbi:HK97-gp10 family putative phage morphogenesis protein [Kribbella qitaiheensis]|uniref:HK97-gp10 family putative phage morphogenesis protein n=1 Tax=Kribbella qitaiheensis TaxID=1544730 RepID=UPI003615701D